MVVAGLGVILYVIGIPLVAMILLYHQKKRFQVSRARSKAYSDFGTLMIVPSALQHSTNAYFSFLVRPQVVLPTA